MTQLTDEEKKLIVAALLEYDSGPNISYSEMLKILAKLDIPESYVQIVDDEGYLDK